MSTSLLYHAFGIRGYDYVRTDYQDGQVIFTIAQDPQDCRCSACGSRAVISRGQVERRFRCLPIGSRTTAVDFSIPRVECTACGLVRQVKVPFADPRRSYTKSFQRYVLELLRRMTILDVAHHLDVGWDLIQDIQKRDLQRRFAKPKLKHLHTIAIDEIAIAKGHRYLRVVLDLERGAVVFVGDGQGADARNRQDDGRLPAADRQGQEAALRVTAGDDRARAAGRAATVVGVLSEGEDRLAAVVVGADRLVAPDAEGLVQQAGGHADLPV